jgi:hypothetical protein
MLMWKGSLRRTHRPNNEEEAATVDYNEINSENIFMNFFSLLALQCTVKSQH